MWSDLLQSVERRTVFISRVGCVKLDMHFAEIVAIVRDKGTNALMTGLCV